MWNLIEEEPQSDLEPADLSPGITDTDGDFVPDSLLEETLEQVKKKSLNEYIASHGGSIVLSDDGEYSYYGD